MDTYLLTKQKQNLEVLGVLKEALAIPSTNTNFFFFSLIISLPLFFFLIYYESFLLDILVDVSAAVRTLPGNDYYFSYFHYWPLGLLNRLIPGTLNRAFTFRLIQLALLYLLPLHLLEFFTSLVTVDWASKVYREEGRMTLDEMLHSPICKAKLRSALITSVCVLLLSTSTLLGLIWLSINYFVFWSNFFCEVFFAAVYAAAFLALLAKYLEWTAQWNMAVVISILEEVHAVEALTLSGYCSDKRGLALMVVFFFWGVGLRLPCLLFGCHDDEGNINYRIVVQVLLYCLGNVIKWTALMVYYYDCKQRILEKKVGEESGIVVEAADG